MAFINTITPTAADGKLAEIYRRVRGPEGQVDNFAYANRTVSGLGVNIDGEVLGLSPEESADEADWAHT